MGLPRRSRPPTILWRNAGKLSRPVSNEKLAAILAADVVG
jgi:hypothetical protein